MTQEITLDQGLSIIKNCELDKYVSLTIWRKLKINESRIRKNENRYLFGIFILKRVLPIKASQKKNTFQEICPEKKINISHIWNKYYDPLLIVYIFEKYFFD
ncbi:hypothetical protein CMU38_12885 [Elizabethkingia anophelis]|nr:hypothetical protein [Elizabethkingia anophelis]